MKVHHGLTAFALVLCSALLSQCATDQDQEDDDDDLVGDEADAQEDATEQAADEEAEPEEETAAENADEPAAEGGGDDFSAMLAAMVEQQKKTGGEVPVKKTQTAKKSAAQPAAADDSGPQTMWVFVNKAWVFSTPAATGTKVKTLKYGDKVTVTPADQEWVRVGDQQFVRVKDLTDRKSKFGNQPIASGLRVKSETLAVRSAPDLSAKVVGYRKQNEPVTALKEAKGWTEIGQGQYVRTKYLHSGTDAVIGIGDQVFAVKTQSLYIRSEPSLDATPVGVLLKGNKVRVSETKDGWSRIGPNRYIRSKHLESLAH